MKTQLVIEILPSTNLGGAEIALRDRLSILSDAGELLDTTVVDLGARPGVLAHDIQRSARLVTAPRRGTSRWLRDLVTAERPDMVICHSPRAAVVTFLATRRLIPSVPYVVVAHGPDISDTRAKSILLSVPLWLANHFAAKVVGVSSAAIRGPWSRGARRTEVALLGSHLTMSRDQTRANDVINAEVVANNVWSPQTKVKLLGMSRFTPKKNYAMLLSALHRAGPELRTAQAVCALVGYGSAETAMREQARALEIEDLVVFERATSSPGSVMRQADIFLISSTAEGGPLTLYEALLAGTRVVSTSVGAVPDIIGGSYDVGLRMVSGFSDVDFANALIALVRQGPVDESERSDRSERFAHLDTSFTAQIVQSILTNVAGPVGTQL